MRRLSDYQGEEAIELWADIMDSASVIFSDKELRKYAEGSKINLAKAMLKSHKKEVCDILLRIDDTPINGFNIIVRLVQILEEIGANPEVRDFFGMQSQNEQQESSGSATENTEGKKK